MAKAKTIDLSGKLTNERPVLVLSDDKKFPVDNRKNTVFEMQQHMEQFEGTELERVEVGMKLLLGEEAVKEIDEMELSFDGYQMVFIATAALALGEEYEEVEARFQAEK